MNGYPSVKVPVIHLARGLGNEIPGVIPHLPSDANLVSRRGAAEVAFAMPQNVAHAITAPAGNSELSSPAAPARQLVWFLLNNAFDEGVAPFSLNATTWPGQIFEPEVMRPIPLFAPALAISSEHVMEAIVPQARGGEFIGLTGDLSGTPGTP